MAFDRQAYKKEWDKHRQERHTALIQRWKRVKGCSQCGFKDHHAALQLDHMDPSTKDGNRKGRRAINFKWSKPRIKEELSKCVVLCANCHGVKTFENRDFAWWEKS